MVSHGIAFRKLNRTSAHRKALLCNMVTQLIKHDAIETTLPKAKELRRVADQMVTLAKTGDLHARRQAAATIKEPEMVKKLFAEFPERFNDRNGGYTRILKTRRRPGDNAPLALIEYLRETRPEFGLAERYAGGYYVPLGVTPTQKDKGASSDSEMKDSP